MKYTIKNCNLANLCSMFQTCLEAILVCLDHEEYTKARHHIKEAMKSIGRLQKHNEKGGS